MSPPIAGEEKKYSSLQTLMTESALDELELQRRRPLQLVAVNLGGIVTRGVTTLSEMSAELGVVLRIRVRGGNIPVRGDFEKIRRSINALLIHLLTLSQSQACVTVIEEVRMQNGRQGVEIQLSVNHVAVPWNGELDAEEVFAHSQEVTACRYLLEMNGGSLLVQTGDDGGPSFLIWLPTKGPGKR